jgi:hypothetical protein
MRRLTLVALVTCIILAAFLIIPSLAAQTRAVPPGGGSNAGRAVANNTPTVSTSGYTPAPTTARSPSIDHSTTGNRAIGSFTGGFAPHIGGTSFNTVGMYYTWLDYYSYLYSYYHFYPFYFDRFYRNNEPLMTPAMLRITLRQPLRRSEAMLKSIDELDSLLSDARAGKAVDKQAILAKTQEIRDYAKQIRQDPTVSIADIHKDTMLFKDDNVNALDPETIAKLHEMALDLNRQLRNLYSESSTSTVSVESYKEPSFESVAKGIEKACKAIEHSSKRL